MHIRLMGLPGECAEAAKLIVGSDLFDVVEVSRPYRNRGASKQVRVSLDVRLKPPARPDGNTKEITDG